MAKLKSFSIIFNVFAQNIDWKEMLPDIESDAKTHKLQFPLHFNTP